VVPSDKIRHTMLEVGEPAKPSVDRFIVHSALVVFVVPLVGFLNYWIAPISGGIIAFIASRRRPELTSVFSWVPALLLFLWDAWSTFHGWDPSWAHMTRWAYFTNTMFGPNCSDSECLHTISTAILAGSVGYSFVSLAVLHQSRFKARSN
jgi:hypothetical protein